MHKTSTPTDKIKQKNALILLGSTFVILLLFGAAGFFLTEANYSARIVEFDKTTRQFRDLEPNGFKIGLLIGGCFLSGMGAMFTLFATMHHFIKRYVQTTSH